MRFRSRDFAASGRSATGPAPASQSSGLRLQCSSIRPAIRPVLPSGLQRIATLTMPAADSSSAFPPPLDSGSHGGSVRGLPGSCAHTSTLIRAASTPRPSGQASGFDDICRLISLAVPFLRFLFITAAFCLRLPSDPPRGGHPCRPASTSPCRACRGLQPPYGRALPDAQTKNPEQPELLWVEE